MFAPLLHGQNRSSHFNPRDLDDDNKIFWINHDPENITESVNKVTEYKNVVGAVGPYEVYGGSLYPDYDYPRLTLSAEFNNEIVGDYFGYNVNGSTWFGFDNHYSESFIQEPQSPYKKNITAFMVIGATWEKNPYSLNPPLSIFNIALQPDFGHDNLSISMETIRTGSEALGWNLHTKIKATFTNKNTSTNTLWAEWEDLMGSFEKFEDIPTNLEVAKVYVLSFTSSDLSVNGILVMEWSALLSTRLPYVPYTFFRHDPNNFYGLMTWNNM